MVSKYRHPGDVLSPYAGINVLKFSGPGQKTLRYGGESTCVEVTSDKGQKIVIDAGSGIRRLGNQMLKDKTVSRINLLLTHSHWDHLSGFPFFAPAYLPDFSIDICGPHGAAVCLEIPDPSDGASVFPCGIQRPEGQI